MKKGLYTVNCCWLSINLSSACANPVMLYITTISKSQAFLFSLAVVVVLLYLSLPVPHDLPNQLRAIASKSTPQNRTLGFQRVFAINFPSRTDKKDTIILASSLTGFDVSWLPGIAATEIAEKAAPPTWDYALQTPGALGCWRAHMNVLQQIVAERISTALIIEDDADWDVLLKSQLRQLGDGLHTLTGSDPSSSTYGSGWDMLWLGHCRSGPSNFLQDFYVIESDPTVPPVPHRRAKWRQLHIPPQVLQNDTRLIYRSYASMCTAAYAVTLAGAQKILSAVSLSSQNQPVDVSYSSMCRGKLVPDFMCYATYPPLFGSHRPAGPESRDSDLNNHTGPWHEEYTYDIVYSATQNIPRLVTGHDTATAQWPGDVDLAEIPLNTELKLGKRERFEVGAMPEQTIQFINNF